ncbi:MAG: N-acetylmuramoyl-L-alanine amidase [Paracoccaceae bacterium]
MRLAQRPSPNFGARRHGGVPDMVVLHHTAMASCEAACARLCDPDSGVSAHYLVAQTGAVFALVDEQARAWHAGAGRWGRITDVNSHSIGIELANAGPLEACPPFPEPQMAALERLLALILARWSIPPERVIAHSDMAPGRKTDPGRKFDWRRLARAGLSVWPERGANPDPALFRANCEAFGYAPGLESSLLLSAFRQRFRPWADGPLMAGDAWRAAALAQRFPVDPDVKAS